MLLNYPHYAGLPLVYYSAALYVCLLNCSITTPTNSRKQPTKPGSYSKEILKQTRIGTPCGCQAKSGVGPIRDVVAPLVDARPG